MATPVRTYTSHLPECSPILQSLNKPSQKANEGGNLAGTTAIRGIVTEAINVIIAMTSNPARVLRTMRIGKKDQGLIRNGVRTKTFFVVLKDPIDHVDGFARVDVNMAPSAIFFMTLVATTAEGRDLLLAPRTGVSMTDNGRRIPMKIEEIKVETVGTDGLTKNGKMDGRAKIGKTDGLEKRKKTPIQKTTSSPGLTTTIR